VTSSQPIACRFILRVCLCLIVLAGCQYDVPITSSPTGKVQEGLLGNWMSIDGKELMKVRPFDESTYIVYYDGDLFRAHHSDIDGTPLVTVQDLNPGNRKFAFISWKLSDYGKTLTLRSVNDTVVPAATKDSTAVVALLKQNAHNPELFGEEGVFKKTN
jgi:hypothetical protein